MQINALSSTNFESKGYYISPSARENAKTLLMLMKRSTSHKLNPAKSEWQTEILSSLSMKNKINFSNSRLFLRTTENPELNKTIPDFTLKIGKNLLHVNSTTGEVLHYNIGIFTSLNRLISKADKYIEKFLKNFNNSNVVKRNTFETGGYIEIV